MQTQVPQAAVFIQGQEALTASMLAAAPPNEQKQMLGERLFPLIQSMHQELAGKITDMLLEIDNSELVHMLEHQESLKGKVEEAVVVIQAQKTDRETVGDEQVDILTRRFAGRQWSGFKSGYISAQPAPVKRRLKALKKIQLESMKVEAKFYEEVHKLVCKYQDMYQPLREKRSKIIKGEHEPNDDECQWSIDDNP